MSRSQNRITTSDGYNFQQGYATIETGLSDPLGGSLAVRAVEWTGSNTQRVFAHGINGGDGNTLRSSLFVKYVDHAYIAMSPFDGIGFPSQFSFNILTEEMLKVGTDSSRGWVRRVNAEWTRISIVSTILPAYTNFNQMIWWMPRTMGAGYDYTGTGKSHQYCGWQYEVFPAHIPMSAVSAEPGEFRRTTGTAYNHGAPRLVGF